MTPSYLERAGLGRLLLAHSARGWVRVSGSDRVRFLHAMLSNDIHALTDGAGCPALLLDRKGHVLSILYVVREPDTIWLDASPGTSGEVVEVLEKHVIADDVTLTDLSEDWTHYSIEGPTARELLGQLGLPAPEPDRTLRDARDRIWCGGGVLSRDGVRCWLPRHDADELLAQLRADEALQVLDERQAAALYVASGVPRLGVDVSERNFPHEANLERRAVSFKKGCYIGQEIVARIHSRGSVNRLLVKLAFRGEVRAGDSISGEGRERLGVVTSVVPIEALPGELPAELREAKCLALGYVAKESARPGVSVEVGEVPGTVADLALG